MHLKEIVSTERLFPEPAQLSTSWRLKEPHNYLVIFSEPGSVSRTPDGDSTDEDAFVVVLVGRRTQASGDGQAEALVGALEPDVGDLGGGRRSLHLV